jgi:hypothetical protein
VWKRINALFNWLPLAALIEGKILCMHGGIGRCINQVGRGRAGGWWEAGARQSVGLWPCAERPMRGHTPRPPRRHPSAAPANPALPLGPLPAPPLGPYPSPPRRPTTRLDAPSPFPPPQRLPPRSTKSRRCSGPSPWRRAAPC